MNRSMPGLLVHHQLPEFTQTQVHRVSDAIQPSRPLSSSREKLSKTDQKAVSFALNVIQVLIRGMDKAELKVPVVGEKKEV